VLAGGSGKDLQSITSVVPWIETLRRQFDGESCCGGSRVMRDG
jgi:hypothetical protein